ncbi:hypothetical protein D5086_014000 [Populus alba]|uniref:Uncharacterized protein n=1 Tax=Populus alba TaxID=43335 RepID=A0ACC4C832_POPAL
MPTSVLSVVSLGIFLVLVSSHEGTGRARQSKCSNRDIVIAQAQVQSQPSGLPTFLVEITTTNTKVQVSNIHFYCEQFSSAILIRPDVFKCIAVNDSLVNRGKPLASGLTLSFTYANIFDTQDGSIASLLASVVLSLVPKSSLSSSSTC